MATATPDQLLAGKTFDAGSDGALGVQIDPNHLLTPGTYRFHLVVVDDGGNQGTADATVTVVDATPRVTVAPATQTVELGHPFRLSATATPAGTHKIAHFIWSAASVAASGGTQPVTDTGGPGPGNVGPGGPPGGGPIIPTPAPVGPVTGSPIGPGTPIIGAPGGGSGTPRISSPVIGAPILGGGGPEPAGGGPSMAGGGPEIAEAGGGSQFMDEGILEPAGSGSVETFGSKPAPEPVFRALPPGMVVPPAD